MFCGSSDQVESEEKMNAARLAAVVTGANKNIGYYIAQGLSKQLPVGSTVWLCSRDADRGKAAVEKMNATPGKVATIKMLQLDISDSASVKAAADTLKKEEPNGIDILVNNAGFAFKAAATEPVHVQAKETLKVNFFGTLQTSKALIPLLRKNGRVVNVGSSAGILAKWGEERRQLWANPNITEAQLISQCNEYVKDMESGKNCDLGWPNTTYGVSKAAVGAMTRIHARDLAKMGVKDPTGCTVNVCCPGWCKSDMAGWDRPPKTSEQGADTPIFLALGGGENGKFYRDRVALSY